MWEEYKIQNPSGKYNLLLQRESKKKINFKESRNSLIEPWLRSALGNLRDKHRMTDRYTDKTDYIDRVVDL